MPDIVATHLRRLSVPASRALKGTTRLLLFVIALAIPARAAADVALLLQEPYGRLGRLSPTGHVAVYLTGVCAASPVQLRRCAPGEMGAVISRYAGVAGLDWVAMPLMPYFYGVDHATDVPRTASVQDVSAIRDAYRVRHLQGLIPDGRGGRTPRGNWVQLVGAAYDRRILAFSLPTTPAQDDLIIATLNAAPNRSRYDLLRRNCADFARDVVNIAYPGALRSTAIADLGVTTPKQIATGMVTFQQRRPDLELSAFSIDQVLGSRPPSGTTRGILEALVPAKKYTLPLAAVGPWVTTGFASGSFSAARAKGARPDDPTYGAAALEAWATRSATTD